MPDEQQGDARYSMGTSGTEESRGGLDMELIYEDDLEFQIASF
ncbi:hypothetical protein [Pyxidicoccus parkwayensis]|nr:hypothetical protein [Pyxidicoccus parkwaysis]